MSSFAVDRLSWSNGSPLPDQRPGGFAYSVCDASKRCGRAWLYVLIVAAWAAGRRRRRGCGPVGRRADQRAGQRRAVGVGRSEPSVGVVEPLPRSTPGWATSAPQLRLQLAADYSGDASFRYELCWPAASSATVVVHVVRQQRTAVDDQFVVACWADASLPVLRNDVEPSGGLWQLDSLQVASPLPDGLADRLVYTPPVKASTPSKQAYYTVCNTLGYCSLHWSPSRPYNFDISIINSSQQQQ